MIQSAWWRRTPDRAHKRPTAVIPFAWSLAFRGSVAGSCAKVSVDTGTIMVRYRDLLLFLGSTALCSSSLDIKFTASSSSDTGANTRRWGSRKRPRWAKAGNSSSSTNETQSTPSFLRPTWPVTLFGTSSESEHDQSNKTLPSHLNSSDSRTTQAPSSSSNLNSFFSGWNSGHVFGNKSYQILDENPKEKMKKRKRFVSFYWRRNPDQNNITPSNNSDMNGNGSGNADTSTSTNKNLNANHVSNIEENQLMLSMAKFSAESVVSPVKGQDVKRGNEKDTTFPKTQTAGTPTGDMNETGALLVPRHDKKRNETNHKKLGMGWSLSSLSLKSNSNSSRSGIEIKADKEESMFGIRRNSEGLTQNERSEDWDRNISLSCDITKGADETRNEENNETSPDLGKFNNTEANNSDINPDSEQVTDDMAIQKQYTNHSRPAIVYFSSPHSPPANILPRSQLMPHPRSPYMPPQPQSPHRSRKPPSLLSLLLSTILPSPSPSPPSPYGPALPPSSPYPPHNNETTALFNTLFSLLLRVALLSITTHLLDFIGLGSSHSDSAAFLPTPAQHYTFERINDRYLRDGAALKLALSSPPPGIRKRKWKRVFGKRKKGVLNNLFRMEPQEGLGDSMGAPGKESLISGSRVEAGNTNTTAIDAATKPRPMEPSTLTNGNLYNRTVIIVDIKPDSRVGNGVAEQLRDTVTFLIEQHRDHTDKRRFFNSYSHRPSRRCSIFTSHLPRSVNGIRSAIGEELEILLLLESPGGTVHDFGLASSHLYRLRNEPHITLSICIDRIAASGGYMMACQATPGHLFAAPFAMVGSIGVLMETVNFHDVLKKYGVKPLVIKAGKNKAPLKTLGEVTKEEMEMAQRDAEAIHAAFQEWVLRARSTVTISKDWIDKVCTGAVFLGKEACDLGLIDRVLTSDEYVAERIAAGDRILRLIPYKGPQFGIKLSPLDLLFLGTDAEGRAKLREKAHTLCSIGAQFMAPLLRVGSIVSFLNLIRLLAHLQSAPDISW